MRLQDISTMVGLCNPAIKPLPGTGICQNCLSNVVEPLHPCPVCGSRRIRKVKERRVIYNG